MIAAVDVKIRDATVGYVTGCPILNGFSLDVPANEVTAICGRSGCGKTTLLRLIAGMLRPVTGEVSILVGDKAYDGPIGLVTQGYTNFPWMTARQNIAHGALVGGATGAYVEEVVDTILSDFGLNANHQDYPTALSGGQNQRVAVGRAVAANPGLLLLDEPFSALDPLMRLWLSDLLFARTPHQRTVLLVTHDVDEAVRIADRIVIFDGRQHERSPVVDLSSLGPPGDRNPIHLASKREAIIFMMNVSDGDA